MATGRTICWWARPRTAPLAPPTSSTVAASTDWCETHRANADGARRSSRALRATEIELRMERGRLVVESVLLIVGSAVRRCLAELGPGAPRAQRAPEERWARQRHRPSYT